MGAYKLSIKSSAAKELDLIPNSQDRRRIIFKIQGLSVNPRPQGVEKLAGYADCYRLRQGRYRLAYLLDDQAKEVVVYKIGHRKDVYR